MKILYTQRHTKKRRKHKPSAESGDGRSGGLVLCCVLPRRAIDTHSGDSSCLDTGSCSAHESKLVSRHCTARDGMSSGHSASHVSGNVDCGRQGGAVCGHNACLEDDFSKMLQDYKAASELVAETAYRACSGWQGLPVESLSVSTCHSAEAARAGRVQLYVSQLRRLLAPQGGVFFAARLRRDMRRLAFGLRRIDPPLI